MDNQMTDSTREVNKNLDTNIMKRSNKAMVKMIHAKASQLAEPIKIKTIDSKDN